MKLLLALLLVVQTARAEFSLKDDGKLFTIRIPKSDFKPGTNTLTIDKRSGLLTAFGG